MQNAKKKKEIWGKRQNQEIDEQNKEIECKKRKKNTGEKKLNQHHLMYLWSIWVILQYTESSVTNSSAQKNSYIHYSII